MSAIADILAREILDSRGNPTVEVEVFLESGATGRAAVPSGASTGAHEAVELRDGDMSRYGGKGVLRAVAAAQGEILEAIGGMDAAEQIAIEIESVGGQIDTYGGNNSFGVNLEVLSSDLNLGLNLLADVVLNPGQHADNPIDIQEFMIQPVGAASLADAVRMGAEIFHALRKQLKDAGHNTNVGDEGGFAPNIGSAEDALAFISKACEAAGYRPGEDVTFALDCAATEFFKDGVYDLEGEGKRFDAAGMVDYLAALCARFPIDSIEDGCAEDDWAGWKHLTGVLGAKVQLVGDDLFVTNPERLRQGIETGTANAILVKVNQIGTLSETLEAVEMAQRAGFRAVMSHRSGETEDATIADLAVATNCGQIKTGSLARSDRTAKYNQLIRIEEILGSSARYAGRSILRR